MNYATATRRRQLDRRDKPFADISLPECRTEIANAKRFAFLHGESVRYCPQWGKWLYWDGTRWQIDYGSHVEALAKEVAADVWEAVKEELPSCDRGDQMTLLSFAKMTSSANGISHTLTLARSEEGMAVQPDQLDCDPWVLNVQNGTLDLRTGKLRSHSREDMLTKLAPVVFAEHCDCPTWVAFLERILPDEDVRRFMQRLVGYWLTGSTRDHVLPILYGIGANGKSVFLNTVMALLGDDYACQAAPDLLMAKQSSHPTELADLHGRRLVCSIESGEGRRLNEPLIKQLTGGDSIRCRRMREDFWSFKPSHKLATATNHRPRVQGTDHGMWRRLRLILFGVVIPPAEQDKTLPEKLAKELPGILNWALAGCKEWQVDGLNEPASIMAATEDYKRDEDGIQRFIEERCLVNSGISAGATPLYRAYQNWCDDVGEPAVKQRVFGGRLADLGFKEDRGNGGRVIRHGIGLAAEEV